MINLLAPEMKRQIRAARGNVALLNYCVAIGFTLVLCVGIFGAGVWLTMQDRASAEARTAQNQAAAAVYAETRQQAESFANDLKQAKTILSGNVSFYNFITQIAAVVPPGVILSNLTLGTSTLNAPISMSARTTTYEKAVELKNSLAESPIFDTVNLTNATTTTGAGDSIGARYPVTATLSATFSQDFIKGTTR